MKRALAAHRSVHFMAWLTVLLVIGGVSACHLAAPMADAQLAGALYSAAHQRAVAEVGE